jgi:hypothetical protein
MLLRKITDKGPSKVKETKLKQEKLRVGHLQNMTVFVAAVHVLKEVAEAIEGIYRQLRTFNLKF